MPAKNTACAFGATHRNWTSFSGTLLWPAVFGLDMIISFSFSAPREGVSPVTWPLAGVRVIAFDIAKARTLPSVRSDGQPTVITEVRRQFESSPGIMQGTSDPDYATCVDIVTKSALKAMVLPGIVPVIGPVAVGVVFRHVTRRRR